MSPCVVVLSHSLACFFPLLPLLNSSTEAMDALCQKAGRIWASCVSRCASHRLVCVCVCVCERERMGTAHGNSMMVLFPDCAAQRMTNIS